MLKTRLLPIVGTFALLLAGTVPAIAFSNPAGAAVRRAALKADQPCHLLTGATIKRVTGAVPTSASQSPGFNPGETQCDWVFGMKGQLVVTYEARARRAQLTAPNADGLLGPTAKKVSGVGGKGGVAWAVCGGKPAQCELRANAEGKTFDLVLALPQPNAALLKMVLALADDIYAKV